MEHLSSTPGENVEWCYPIECSLKNKRQVRVDKFYNNNDMTNYDNNNNNNQFFLDKTIHGKKGAVRLTLCKAPTCETRADHNTSNFVPYSL